MNKLTGYILMLSVAFSLDMGLGGAGFGSIAFAREGADKVEAGNYFGFDALNTADPRAANYQGALAQHSDPKPDPNRDAGGTAGPSNNSGIGSTADPQGKWGAGATGSAGGWPPSRPSPPVDLLVLDLDGDGIELVAVKRSTTRFDFVGDGIAERTGWLAPDDGFLVWNKNRNGKVDGISELFGNQTTDGYVALRTLDSDGNGIINAQNAAFKDLKVWRDLNGNGQSEAGELFSLAELGITALGLERTVNGTLLAGNEIAFNGTFTRTDGSTGQTGAIFFETNRTLSRWVRPDNFVVDDLAKKLPQLRGYGTLTDLDVAMTQNAALRDQVDTSGK